MGSRQQQHVGKHMPSIQFIQPGAGALFLAELCTHADSHLAAICNDKFETFRNSCPSASYRCKFPEQACQTARLRTSFRPLSSSIGLALPVTWGAVRTIAARGTGEHGNARLGTKTRRINDDDGGGDDDLRSKSSQMIILMDEVDANRTAAAAGPPS